MPIIIALLIALSSWSSQRPVHSESTFYFRDSENRYCVQHEEKTGSQRTEFILVCAKNEYPDLS